MCSALSVDMSKQKPPLLEMIETMSALKFSNKKGHSGEKIFQKGKLIVNDSTEILLQNVYRFLIQHLFIMITTSTIFRLKIV